MEEQRGCGEVHTAGSMQGRAGQVWAFTRPECTPRPLRCLLPSPTHPPTPPNLYAGVSEGLALPPRPEAEAAAAPAAAAPALPRAPEAVAAEQEAARKVEEAAARQRCVPGCESGGGGWARIRSFSLVYALIH